MTNTNPEPSYTRVTIHNQFDFKRILATIAVVGVLGFIGKVVYSYAFPEKSPLQLCQESYMESVNAIYRENENTAKKCTEEYGKDIYKLNKCTSSPLAIPVNTCGVSLNATGGIAPVPPSGPTLREQFGLGDCRFTNKDHRMNKYNLAWTAYDIACEPGKSFDVKSPGDYKIEKIGHGANMGDYIILKNDGDFRIVLAHIQTSRNVGERLKRGDIIGQTNLSGLSTGMHVHIELWYKYFILTSPAIYGGEHQRENQWGLLKHRGWNFGQPKDPPYYFTAYNLGDVKQNDSSPCIGSSGVDLCYLEASGVRTMALTVDIRNKLGVKLGEKVKLEGENGCEGVYEVHDEMNCRFRGSPCWYKKDGGLTYHPTGNVLRPGTPYFIKGDIPSKKGGACFVTKL